VTSLIYGRHKGGLSKRQCGCVCIQEAGPSFCSSSASSWARGLGVQECLCLSSKWVAVSSSRELGF